MLFLTYLKTNTPAG